MPQYDVWKEQRSFEYIQGKSEGPRLLWIHRPILVHRASNNGAICLCGCLSRRAVCDPDEEIDHLDILVSRITGGRMVQRAGDDGDDRRRFQALADQAQRIDAPIRCYEEQLPAILDRQHKIVAMFGGARGGKTTALAEWLGDAVFTEGGPGAQFWWVAPSRGKTQVGVDKLVRGGRTDRWVQPVIPPELVASYPEHETQQDQAIRLIDGSVVFLKHAGRRGGNLKGDPAIAIAIDELCEIDHIENFQIILDRLTDSGGQVGTATTPVAGHWARETISDRGVDYVEAARLEGQGDPVDVISLSVSAYRNPWQDPKEIERRIRAGGGPDNPMIRREVFGEWVGEGPTLWQHFRDKPKAGEICHLRDGPWRDVDGWGLANVTKLAAGHFFAGTNSDLAMVGGLDFNIWPMSLVVCQVACPPDLDQSDPRNWILFVMDEVVKRGTVFDFAKFLAERAGLYRKQPAGYFSGLAISCDATGAQFNPPASHGLTSRSSTLARTITDHGFDCRPCHYTDKGSPANPAKLDQVSLLHKLQIDTVDSPKYGKWPRLVVHATRCPKLLLALQTQEADDKGRPLKESGTASDRLSGPTDALMYLAWALFSQHDATAPPPQITL